MYNGKCFVLTTQVKQVVWSPTHGPKQRRQIRMASISAAILSKGKSNPFNPVKSVMKAPTDKLAHRLQVSTYTSLEKGGGKQFVTRTIWIMVW